MAEDKKLQKKLAKFEEEIMNLARTECSTIEAETQSNLESQRASLKAAATPKPPSTLRPSFGRSTGSSGPLPSAKRTA